VGLGDFVALPNFPIGSLWTRRSLTESKTGAIEPQAMVRW